MKTPSSIPVVIKLAYDTSGMYYDEYMASQVKKAASAEEKPPKHALTKGTFNAAAGAGLVGSQLLGIKLMRAWSSSKQEDAAKKLFGKYAPKAGVGLGDTKKFMESQPKLMRTILAFQGANKTPFYEPSGRNIYNIGRHARISFAQNPETVGHELGHAFNHKAIGKAYGPLTYLRLAPAALPLGVYKYIKHRDTDDKKAKAWMGAGLGAAGIGTAAILADEGIASARSMKMMKDMKLPKAVIRAGRKNLGTAFGNYALMFGLPLAATAGLYAYDRSRIRKQRNERTS